MNIAVLSSLVLVGFSSSLMMVFNSKVGSVVGYLEGTFVFLIVGTLCLIVPTVFGWTPGNIGLLNQVPKIYLTAGAINIIIIAVSSYAINVYGPGTVIPVVIAVRILASQLMDHFGILVEQRPLTPVNMVGALLLIAGLVLVI